MTQSTKATTRTSTRRLDQAIEYVARTWFPANPEVLERIRNRADSGKYEDDFELLLNDLKSDFAIFSFMLKELRGFYPDDAKEIDPIKLMRSMNRKDLLKLITIPSDAISSHSFQEMEKAQANRLKHFIWSCSTSEMLADKSEATCSAEQVFTVAVVRQLGLNLIAWNYPSIYGRVLQSLKEGAEGELDQLLADQIGFEPIELAAALTYPEKLNSELTDILGMTRPSDENGMSDTALMQRKLCEIGEAFAILNDPESYPTGTPAARTSIQEIEEILGPGGTDSIVKSIKSRYVSYIATNPDFIATDNANERARQNINPYGKALYNRNSHAQRLPDNFKDRLAAVYGMVMKGQVSTDGIQQLVSDLIPFAGFSRGCIFLLEQREYVLIPRLRIGNDNLKRYKAVSCMDSGLQNNPIYEAFYSSFPIKQSGAVYLGDTTSLIAGVLGTTERAGVLYLEMPDGVANSTLMDVNVVFKALRQCMNDCLNLK